jgi:hypothetical protein
MQGLLCLQVDRLKHQHHIFRTCQLKPMKIGIIHHHQFQFPMKIVRIYFIQTSILPGHNVSIKAHALATVEGCHTDNNIKHYNANKNMGYDGEHLIRNALLSNYKQREKEYLGKKFALA